MVVGCCLRYFKESEHQAG
jgi:hypothetical protein